MSTISKAIDLAIPQGGRLLVTRNDAKGKLTLSVCLRGGRGNIIASVALDAKGWNDLSQCVALPPASVAEKGIS